MPLPEIAHKAKYLNYEWNFWPLNLPFIQNGIKKAKKAKFTFYRSFWGFFLDLQNVRFDFPLLDKMNAMWIMLLECNVTEIIQSH